MGEKCSAVALSLFCRHIDAFLFNPILKKICLPLTLLSLFSEATLYRYGNQPKSPEMHMAAFNYGLDHYISTNLETDYVCGKQNSMYH